MNERLSSNPDLLADLSVPAVMFQVSNYSFQHGSLGAIRSLGRMGVKTYLVAGNRLAPHCLSRYLQKRFQCDSSSEDQIERTVLELKRIAQEIGRPAVLIPTDDEAAIFVAQRAADLQGLFLFPRIDPDMIAGLASKRGLSDACVKHGTPTPFTCYAERRRDALAATATATFPIAVKNSEPWHRLSHPAVGSTTIIRSREEFSNISNDWPENPKVVLQEYLPPEHCEDWIVHMYCDSAATPLVAFSGRKYRSWPPQTGVTTFAAAETRKPLLALARSFCKAVGYSGIVDMDWRLDKRDGLFKLVDFNPRLGANFRLFSNHLGIDVVRAMYLDLTGQTVPTAPTDDSRRFKVENLDFISKLADRRQGAPAYCHPVTTEHAWFALDDPMPFFAMGLRFGGQGIRLLARMALNKMFADKVRPVYQSAPVPDLHDS